MLVGVSIIYTLKGTIRTYKLNNVIRVNLVNLSVRLVNFITVNRLKSVRIRLSEYKPKKVIEKGKEREEGGVKVLKVTYY